MSRMTCILMMNDKGSGPRLSGHEVEVLFEFCFQAHDHGASTPAVPMFWQRTPKDATLQWAN